jgi:cobalt-zinc-cadmium efflux system outer membrane protein
MERETTRGSRLLALAALVALAGCQSYEPKPLDPEKILEEVEATRHSEPEGEVVTLARATELMQAHNPRVLEVRAAYETAHARAEIDTPLPNPTLSAGPLLFKGGEFLTSQVRGWEGALGWAIPLGGQRGVQDELNDISAEAAMVEVVGTEREEYLSLRREFVLLALAGRMVRAQEELAAAAETSAQTVRLLIDAAQATALDLRQIQLEALEAEADALFAREQETEARGGMAARTGTWMGAFRSEGLPPMPPEIPAAEQLRQLLLSDHPGLAQLRADYLVAEKELHLEITRQYPSLQFALEFEREVVSNRFGLPIGIELPIFDRNQQGIAEARARREEVRVRFEADASRSLAAIEVARARLEARRRHLEILQEKTAPAATEALELARRLLTAGVADALQFLAVLRAEREVRIKTLEAEQGVYEAWFDLEEACGAPLLGFPDEERKETP